MKSAMLLKQLNNKPQSIQHIPYALHCVAHNFIKPPMEMTL